MPSNEQLLYINAILFFGIALLGIRLVRRSWKSMAGKDDRYVTLTIAGRLFPALGCVAGGLVFMQTDLIHAVAILAGFTLVGVGLSLIGQRFAKTDRGQS
jgi:hypothetical protein